MNCEKCVCGSTDITTEYDVGFDIDDSGESRQHIQTCNDCGSWRMYCSVIEYREDGMESKEAYGEWIEPK